jgi:uncharacterized membrane protein
MGIDSTGYRVLFLLHLAAVIVGFGSNFVFSMLGARARSMELPGRYAINHVSYKLQNAMTTYPIIAAAVFGIALVGSSDDVYKFDQGWVSAAFLMVILILVVVFVLQMPNLKAMDALEESLVAGKGSAEESAELDERAAKAPMFAGLIHLLWLLLMIDMIWKFGH